MGLPPIPIKVSISSAEIELSDIKQAFDIAACEIVKSAETEDKIVPSISLLWLHVLVHLQHLHSNLAAHPASLPITALVTPLYETCTHSSLRINLFDRITTPIFLPSVLPGLPSAPSFGCDNNTVSKFPFCAKWQQL